MRRRILFEAEAFEDYNAWAKMDLTLINFPAMPNSSNED